MRTARGQRLAEWWTYRATGVVAFRPFYEYLTDMPKACRLTPVHGLEPQVVPMTAESGLDSRADQHTPTASAHTSPVSARKRLRTHVGVDVQLRPRSAAWRCGIRPNVAAGLETQPSQGTAVPAALDYRWSYRAPAVIYLSTTSNWMEIAPDFETFLRRLHIRVDQ
jgi:hypothetical protein